MAERKAGPLALTLGVQLYEGEACAEARIAISDRGLLLGDGLFETLPVLGGTALWWAEHKQRLIAGAGGIALSIEPEQLEAAIEPLVSVCRKSGTHGIIRLTVTRGSGGRGLLPPPETEPTILATLAPFPLSMVFEPASLITSAITRNDTSPVSRLKSLNYLDNILATREAQKAGADDALLFNTKGRVASTTICNLFVLKGDRLMTPPSCEGILSGILRGQLLNLASTLGFSIAEEPIAAETLKKADGLFLTNSLRMLRPVTSLDGHVFDPAHYAPATNALMNGLRDRIEQETGVRLCHDET